MKNSKWTNRQKFQRYLIADVGVNHENSMDKAKLMISQIKDAGWDCVKFQIYTADTIAQKDSPSYWDTTKEEARSQYELFSKYDKFTVENYIELYEYSNHVGIDFCGTIFNESLIHYFDALIPFYKIASADLTNLLLIECILKTGKDIILSTGASDYTEIANTIDFILKNKQKSSKVILLHCVLNYPTLYEHADLSKIYFLRDKFSDIEIGYSDHVPPDDGLLCLVTAYAAGAKVIEKHFTYDKSLKGNDHYHSYDYNDALSLKNKLEKIDILNGNDEKDVRLNQSQARQYARRSIVAKKDIHVGDKLTIENLTALRPFNGISPIKWPAIKGKFAKKTILKDSLLTEGDY